MTILLIKCLYTFLAQKANSPSPGDGCRASAMSGGAPGVLRSRVWTKEPSRP